MPPDIPHRIPILTGAELRQIRERLGLTRASLAHHLHFADESRVRCYERGYVTKHGKRYPYLIPDSLATCINDLAEQIIHERHEARIRVLHTLAILSEDTPQAS